MSFFPFACPLDKAYSNSALVATQWETVQASPRPHYCSLIRINRQRTVVTFHSGHVVTENFRRRQRLVKVTRMSGTAPWIAYAVVNDGGKAGERTGDGAYVPMCSREEAGLSHRDKARPLRDPLSPRRGWDGRGLEGAGLGGTSRSKSFPMTWPPRSVQARAVAQPSRIDPRPIRRQQGARVPLRRHRATRRRDARDPGGATPPERPSSTASRSPMASPPPTRRGLSTGISSPRTCSSRETVGSRSLRLRPRAASGLPLQGRPGLADRGRRATTAAKQTSRSLSPEQIRGLPADARSDIFRVRMRSLRDIRASAPSAGKRRPRR